MLLVALVGSVVTHAVGLEAVLGAFVGGIVLGRSRFYDAEVSAHLSSAALGFFAPLFFATAGLRVDLGLLAEPEVALWGAVVVVAATALEVRGRAARQPARGPRDPRRAGARRRAERARRRRDRARDRRALDRRAERAIVRAGGADGGGHLGDGAAAAARTAPGLAGLGGGAGAPGPGARPRRQRAGAPGAHAAAEPRRAELGAGRAHRRPRLAGGTGRQRARGRGRRARVRRGGGGLAAFTRRSGALRARGLGRSPRVDPHPRAARLRGDRGRRDGHAPGARADLAPRRRAPRREPAAGHHGAPRREGGPARAPRLPPHPGALGRQADGPRGAGGRLQPGAPARRADA